MYEETKKNKKWNKKECREKQTKQNFHLNVNKRPMKKKENKKAAKLQRENKTDFVKRDYYHNKKIQKTKLSKDFSTYFNKYQPWK